MLRMRMGAIALLAVLVALVAGGPLAVAADAPRAPVLYERESVQAKLAPDGGLNQARLYTQLTMDGDGTYTVVDPTSTKNLRNLEGFGKPALTDEGAKWRVDLDGRTAMRTVADYPRDLPLAVDVTYRLDGEPIEPRELVGRSGDVEVTYRLRNVSAVPTELRYKDSNGNFTEETVDIPLPLAGTFSQTLGPSFSHVEAPGGIVAGDGRGNTKLSWSLIMFEPLGSTDVELTYSAVADGAKVAPATVQVVPVRVEQTPLASGNKAYTDASNSTFELAQGATTIDRNVLLLASGAGQLLDGLVKLADGAAELSAGLDRAASGSGELSAGLDKADAGGSELATGLGALRDGSGKLSAGLSKASAGTGALAEGLVDLKAGAGKLSDGLGSAKAGGKKLAAGLGQLADGSGELSAGLSSANAGGAALAGGASKVADGAESATAGAGQLLDGMKQIEGGLATLDKSMPGAVTGAKTLLAGVADLRAALGAPGQANTVLDGLAQLAGAAPYNTAQTGGLPAAKAGVDQIAAGFAGADAKLTEAQTGLTSQSALLGRLYVALEPLGTNCLVTGVAPTPIPCSTATTLAKDGSDSLLAELPGLKSDLAAAGAGMSLLSTKLGAAATGANTLYAGVTTMAGKVQSNSAANPGLREGLSALVDGLTQAATGVTQLHTGQRTAVAGQTKLRAGLDELAYGAAQVASGGNTLSTGLGKLDAGGQQLAGGASAAATGGADLAAGLGLLDAGGKQLAAGAGKAAAGAGELNSGMKQLDAGGKELSAGAGKAASGAAELSSGLGQLNAGGAQLSSGLGDAAAGSTKLADGLVSAKIGGQRVADGSAALSAKGTSKLATSVNDAHAVQNRNVAIIKALDERSRTAGMPVGAIEGATASSVYSFEVAGADGIASQNLWRIVIALLALAALAGLALRRRIPQPPPRGGSAVPRVATAGLQ